MSENIIMKIEKQKVNDYWSRASCGEDLYLTGTDGETYDSQAKSRYDLEGNMIFPFSRFSETTRLKVLEVGVGLGVDHQKFAEAGADLYGISITSKAMEHTRPSCVRATMGSLRDTNRLIDVLAELRDYL